MPDSLSEKKLGRVLVVSALDGWSIALFAGACTLLSLAFAEWVGVLVGTLVTAGGVIELLGNRRLKRGDAGGATALVAAQLIILGTIQVYAAVNLALFDEARIMGQLTAEAGVSALLDQAGITTGDIRPLLRPAFFAFYLTVMLVTLFFQGGLALWYRNRRPAVRQALADRERATPPPMPRG
ncbi:hypothetical protein OPIT5_10730 [Opitutaceae bacterium TAV5]|nr:hypothetical protein OPIT5_10730 [Opitutaceae bacterium TAV5]